MSTHWRRIVAASATGMVVGLSACSPPADPPPPSPRPAIVVQARAASHDALVFSGEIRARQEPSLAFRVGGKITQRHVDVGNRVRQGQVLAELDPGDLRLQAQAAQAQLSAAQAELALAQSEYERHARMLERQLISPALFDAKKAARDAAQAQVDTARAQRTVMRNQTDYARLTAPQDGVIVARRAEAGQVVAAGQSVFELAVDGEREVVIAVPESQIGQISEQQPVRVQLWSQGERLWPGKVREIAPAADPAARTFAVRVSVQAEQGDFEIGQSARVLLQEKSEPGLSLPLSAINGDAGQAHVFVLDPDSSRAQRRPVQIRHWGQHEATISSGISAQDWVVAVGVHLIQDGQTVRAVDRSNRPVRMQATTAP